MEQLHALAGYPQLQDIDVRTQIRQLKIPVYLVQGGHEARGRAEPANVWFANLDAPKKTMVVFELAGHRALFQQPDRFYQLMTGTVLAET